MSVHSHSKSRRESKNNVEFIRTVHDKQVATRSFFATAELVYIIHVHVCTYRPTCSTSKCVSENRSRPILILATLVLYYDV